MSFGDTSIYTVFVKMRRDSCLTWDCDFKKNLLSQYWGTSVFMPVLDLYDIDFHV